MPIRIFLGPRWINRILPGGTRRQLEQQTQERSFCESQQEQSWQPEQQPWLPPLQHRSLAAFSFRYGGLNRSSPVQFRFPASLNKAGIKHENHPGIGMRLIVAEHAGMILIRLVIIRKATHFFIRMRKSCNGSLFFLTFKMLKK